VSKFKLPETQFKSTVRVKSLVKPTWSKEMTVLSTFLESSLNFLSSDIKSYAKLSTVREKSCVKV